jgi:fatty-acyl-CoA synthase
MTGTMMDVPLTLALVLDRASRQFGSVEVVSRRPDKSIHRTTYGAIADRSRQLARALVQLGVKKGDRVATLMWNHFAHLEAYFGIPLSGGVLHTLNLRLHPDEIAWIAEDGGARIVLVDAVLMPLFEKCPKRERFEHVIVVGGTASSGRDYEEVLASANDATRMPELAEGDACGTCYTSGTTGRPKGVVYTHRSTVLHSLVTALPDALELGRRDTLLPVVPMFHVNAWGLPYASALVGAKQVLPGPHLDAPSLLELMQDERVTIAAGVPTIWLAIREALDAEPDRWKLRDDVRMVVGGSAAPEQLIRDLDRHGLHIIHAWGMTETSP